MDDDFEQVAREVMFQHTDYREDHTDTHWAIELKDWPKLAAAHTAEVERAYQRGRIDEAKTCEQAQRHDSNFEITKGA